MTKKKLTSSSTASQSSSKPSKTSIPQHKSLSSTPNQQIVAKSAPISKLKQQKSAQKQQAKNNQVKSQLDDIFSVIPSPGQTDAASTPSSKKTDNLKSQKSSKKPTAETSKQSETGAVVIDDMGFTDSGNGERKRTEEGYRIFTVEELRLGEGGDTPLCPFDCECCWG